LDTPSESGLGVDIFISSSVDPMIVNTPASLAVPISAYHLVLLPVLVRGIRQMHPPATADGRLFSQLMDPVYSSRDYFFLLGAFPS
jgi:hypothetical protein